MILKVNNAHFTKKITNSNLALIRCIECCTSKCSCFLTIDDILNTTKVFRQRFAICSPSFLVHPAPIFETLQFLVVVHQDKQNDLTVAPIACSELEIGKKCIFCFTTNLYNSNFFQNIPKLVVYQHSYSKKRVWQFFFSKQLHRSKMKSQQECFCWAQKRDQVLLNELF